MAGVPQHYNNPGSNASMRCKLGKGTTSVQNNPPLPFPLDTSVAMVWVWVGGFQNNSLFVPLRQNGII